jgi:hypothetical protein
VLEGVDFESGCLFLPGLADELIGSEPSESFESPGEVVGHEEGLQVLFELLMSLIVVALNGCAFESSVHAFDPL